MERKDQILNDVKTFNDTLDQERQFRIIDGEQFENPEYDGDGNIIVRDQYGKVVSPEELFGNPDELETPIKIKQGPIKDYPFIDAMRKSLEKFDDGLLTERDVVVDVMLALTERMRSERLKRESIEFVDYE